MASTTLQIASNIHLQRQDLAFENILTPTADVLALVGGIGSPFHPALSEFVGWCSRKFKLVLFVPGKDEYDNEHGIPVDVINDLLATMCQAHPNVVFKSISL